MKDTVNAALGGAADDGVVIALYAICGVGVIAVLVGGAACLSMESGARRKQD